MKPASSQPSAKKHWIISVTCRRPARTLRTGARPDHGPKNGAMNLEAGLLNFELRPRFWVRNLSPLFEVAKHAQELRHRAPYRQQGEIRWYMCWRQCRLAIHDTVYIYILYIYYYIILYHIYYILYIVYTYIYMYRQYHEYIIGEPKAPAPQAPG